MNFVHRSSRQWERRNLHWLKQFFKRHSTDGVVTVKEFQSMVKSNNPFFTERMFHIFDKYKKGSIPVDDFMNSIIDFVDSSPDFKIAFLFKIYDLNGDSHLDWNELHKLIQVCMEENNLKFSDAEVDSLTSVLFDEVDTHCRGLLTLQEFTTALKKTDGLLENISNSTEQWLLPPEPETSSFWTKVREKWPYALTVPFIRNNLVYVLYMLLFLGINMGLAVFMIVQYWDDTWSMKIGRASGNSLNFISIVVLLMMLRNCITALRTEGFIIYFPLDDHVYFHKLCGYLIVILSTIHSAAHYINFPLHIVPDPELNKGNWTTEQWIFTDAPKQYGLIPGWANITGVILDVVLLIMFLGSLSCVRKSGNFEIFYFSHLLYVVYWSLLILHCPNFWHWIAAPAVLFVFEKVFRFIKTRSGRGKTIIMQGIALPSQVSRLMIKRPPGFTFTPGDYMFINVPAIAKYEWHPFTLSSAPEDKDILGLHIRVVGQWTKKLYKYIQSRDFDDGLTTVQSSGRRRFLNPVRVSDVNEDGRDTVPGVVRETGERLEPCTLMGHLVLQLAQFSSLSTQC